MPTLDKDTWSAVRANVESWSSCSSAWVNTALLATQKFHLSSGSPSAAGRLRGCWRDEGVGMVVTQHPAAPGQGVLVECVGLLILAQLAQIVRERVVMVDECHHLPAAAFDHAVRQIPARRWLGLTATPYRRDELDDLIALQLGPVRHTMSAPEPGTHAAAAAGGAPERSLTVHLTDFVYRGEADPSAPGGIAAAYHDLVADEDRNQLVLTDVLAALARGRNGLVLTQWTAHVALLAELLQAAGHEPVVLRSGVSAGQRYDALERLRPGDGPLLVVATGPYVGEGFDCPALDTLFLAAPITFKGRLVQYVDRVLRAAPGKHLVEVHDYHDIQTGVLASSLRRRAPGYRSLGFPDPSTTRHHPPGRSS